MKKFVKLVSFISLVSLSGSAFAKTGPVSYAFAQLPQAASAAKLPVPVVPAPSITMVTPGGVGLVDITRNCLKDGEVVSAYPAIYNKIHSEENSRILNVFRIIDSRGVERRLEVYFTGGDWMKYGLVYFVTTAGQNGGQVSAYFMNDLSTPDREEGAVAPNIDPFDHAKLVSYISSDFLDVNGNVKAAFGSSAVASASVY